MLNVDSEEVKELAAKLKKLVNEVEQRYTMRATFLLTSLVWVMG